MLTTIGADAMPLIRYRTGDFTRILPPCPCGGITKRIDTVSRWEAKLSMEELDSTLFPIPGLVDYRASFDESLHLDCLCLDLEIAQQVRTAAKRKYPGLRVAVTVAAAARSHRPLYLGKRYIAN